MTPFVKNDIMTDEEYSLLRDLALEEFGIMLKGDKRLTLHAKVSHRLRILGLATYRDYYELIRSDETREELFTFASHITNNETYFFRERPQLDVLPEILKEVKKERQRSSQNSLRLLSLASSSGEEAYTLSIITQESGLFVWDWDVRITGIDVDRVALQKAADACYTGNSFRSVNGERAYIGKYFLAEGDKYVLRRSVARNVEFRHGNITDAASFEGIGGVDVVFCRNVLMYMSDDAIEKIVRNIYAVLSDKGYLFIGSTESLIQKTNLFVPEHVNGVIVYRKNVAEEQEATVRPRQGPS